MDLWSMPPRDARPLLTTERAELVGLLSGLTPAEWTAPTAVPGWTVKDVSLHLLDDDLGWLSRGRDRDASGLLDLEDHDTFVRALAAKNQRWVDGAQGLSLPVVVALLEWAGEQLDQYYVTLDLTARGEVAWAGGPVPEWLDLEQDLTERWVHQQQIRDALGRDDGFARRYLPTVLDAFVWAYPAQYDAAADPGTLVGLDLGVVAGWTLRRNDRAWVLDEGWPDRPAASLRTDPDTAWRLPTGALDSDEVAQSVRLAGLDHLSQPLVGARGILV